MNRQTEQRYEAKDYYAILGLLNNASTSEISKKFRRLALKWHPDKHAEGSSKEHAKDVFQQISEAHEVLSKAETRSNYDVVWRRVHAAKHCTTPSPAEHGVREAPTTTRSSEGPRTAPGKPENSSSTPGKNDFGAWRHPAWTTFAERAARAAETRPTPTSTPPKTEQSKRKSSKPKAPKRPPENPPESQAHKPTPSPTKPTPKPAQRQEREASRERPPSPFSVGELRRSRVFAEMRKEQQAREEAERSKVQDSSSDDESQGMQRRPSRRASEHFDWQEKATAAPMRRTMSEQNNKNSYLQTGHAPLYRQPMDRSRSDGDAILKKMTQNGLSVLIRVDESRSPSPEARPCPEYYTLPGRFPSNKSSMAKHQPTWEAHLRSQEEEWVRSSKNNTVESTQSSPTSSWSVSDLGQYISEVTYNSSAAGLAATKDAMDQVGSSVTTAWNVLFSPKSWFQSGDGRAQTSPSFKCCARCGDLLNSSNRSFCRHCQHAR
mmetsp:Transcript_59860/g.110850  ORF Transcript_59860/g.110850 Transcript_59860/m.110850 type:complete len:491 (+) Transcript_59860:95-1567(+)